MKSRTLIGLLGIAAAFSIAAGDGLAGDIGGSDPDDLVLAAPSVPASDLGALSGGTEDVNINLSNQHTYLEGSVSGNIDTGSITHNTLSNVSGINSLMYNTGNNVSFSSSMQFNINMK